MNSVEVNHALCKLIHRVVFQLQRPSMCFQATLFRTFQKINQEKIELKTNPVYKEIWTLGKFILGKFFQCMQENEKLPVELLLWTTQRDWEPIMKGNFLLELEISTNLLKTCPFFGFFFWHILFFCSVKVFLCKNYSSCSWVDTAARQVDRCLLIFPVICPSDICHIANRHQSRFDLVLPFSTIIGAKIIISTKTAKTAPAISETHQIQWKFQSLVTAAGPKTRAGFMQPAPTYHPPKTPEAKLKSWKRTGFFTLSHSEADDERSERMLISRIQHGCQSDKCHHKSEEKLAPENGVYVWFFRDWNHSESFAAYKRRKKCGQVSAKQLRSDVRNKQTSGDNAGQNECDGHAGIELDDTNVPEHRYYDRQVDSSSESEDKRGLPSFWVRAAGLKHTGPKDKHKSRD